MPTTPHLHNAHLKGETLFHKGGDTGVLLFHGLTATTAEVRPLSQLLIKGGYSVFAPLIPGHGTNPEDLNTTTWRDWTIFAEESLAKLESECSKIFIGGESLGALLALYLASKRPNICGVMAFSPALRLRLKLWERFVLSFLPYSITSLPKRRLDNDLQWQGYAVNPLRAVQQLIKFQKIVLGQLPSVFQPVLIVQGSLDLTIAQECASILQKKLGTETKPVHYLQNSRHVLLLDKEFDRVSELVSNFVQQ